MEESHMPLEVFACLTAPMLECKTMIKLDDLLNEVKPPPQALDLANTEIATKEDFQAAFNKIPEYRIRVEKLSIEEVTGEGENGWRGLTTNPPLQEYTSPLPASMRGLAMDEFYEVNIDWRMLTTARPANKLEEEIFSRYVELGRAHLKYMREGKKNGQETERIIKSVPGRGSLPEVRIPTCRSCGEELCRGVCEDYMYDHYTRSAPEKKMSAEAGSDDEEGGGKVKKKKRKKRKRKGKKTEGERRESDDDADDEN